MKIAHIDVRGTVVLAIDPELEGMPISERIQLSGDEGVIIELQSNHTI